MAYVNLNARLVETLTTTECRDCGWQPDPKRLEDRQADAHCREARHVVVTTMRPAP